MMYKILSLNIRGLNSSRKRRQVFRWLHRQQSDIIFLQETYSTPQTIKRWEAEWGGKIAYSHGSSHSRGVMILFKPRLDVSIEKISTDNYGGCVLVETILGDKKTVFVNIYAPNEARHQISFLDELSNSFLREYINDNVVVGGDFNCVINSSDKRDGKPFDAKLRRLLLNSKR